MTLSITSKHPEFVTWLADWKMMRDLYKGERAVKEKDEEYLPSTSGMRLDGMKPGEAGRAAYDAYKLRAVFHDYVAEAVEHLVGLLHQKPAVIKLPSSMEKLRDRATVTGESLDALLRRINEEQLVTGRLGLLADMPAIPDPENPLPYIAMYTAEAIINWDDGSFEDGVSELNLTVLDETGFEREGFEWKVIDKFRLLQLGDLNKNEVQGEGLYSTGTFRAEAFNPDLMIVPMYKGTVMDEIPFVFCNTKDILPTPDKPPLVGLGRLALAIYRGEADYRQNLFMQGQDTLVVIGGTRAQSTPGDGEEDAPLRTGAGARIDCDIQGDAKYIGVESTGLAEQREAIQNDCAKAEIKAGQLNNPEAGSQESGFHLTTRLGAQTATLNQVALTGAAALEAVLKKIAVWTGANPEEVEVEPNVEFADFDLSGKDLVDLMNARNLGAPISKESIHALMVERGLTKMDYQTETGKIEDEDAQHADALAQQPQPGNLAPGGPNDPQTVQNQLAIQAAKDNKNKPAPSKK